MLLTNQTRRQPHLSDKTRWTHTAYPYQITAGTANPNAALRGDFVSSSNSIVSLPIYDDSVTVNVSGTTAVTIVGFLQVFINRCEYRRKPQCDGPQRRGLWQQCDQCANPRHVPRAGPPRHSPIDAPPPAFFTSRDCETVVLLVWSVLFGGTRLWRNLRGSSTCVPHRRTGARRSIVISIVALHLRKR